MPTPKKIISLAPTTACLRKDLGECVSWDVRLIQHVGWENFVKTRQQDRGTSNLINVKHHPACRLLSHYKHRGISVKLSTQRLDRSILRAALTRGAYTSCNNHLDFLSKEFVEMLHRGQ